MAGNEALGKAPTVEEEMSKFKGFSVKDGEVADGKSQSQADERAAAEARERQAQEANGRSHADNQNAGTTYTEGKSGKPAEVTLTEDEEEAALQALAKEKGTEDLSQEDMHAAIAKALEVKKQAAADKAAGKTRQQKKSDRYDENYRARRAAERRADDLQRQIDELKAGKSALTTDKSGANTSGDDLVKPDHTDTQKYQYGELDPKYLADLSRYETLKALREEKANQGKTQQSEADAAAAAEFKERVDAFMEAGRDEFDDFSEVVEDTMALPKNDPGFWPLTPTVAELALESDHGRQIIYDLASDTKEAKRIAALSPARQAIWFGQQEAKHSAGSAASDENQGSKARDGANGKPTQHNGQQQNQNSQPRESKAPVPLRTKLNGSGGNRVPNSATTDFAAFEAMAAKRR